MLILFDMNVVRSSESCSHSLVKAFRSVLLSQEVSEINKSLFVSILIYTLVEKKKKKKRHTCSYQSRRDLFFFCLVGKHKC